MALEYVDPVDITELLGNHFARLSSEERHDLAQQLTEQQLRDEDEEDRGIEELQTKDFAGIFLVIDIAAEKLCDIDPN